MKVKFSHQLYKDKACSYTLTVTGSTSAHSEKRTSTTNAKVVHKKQ